MLTQVVTMAGLPLHALAGAPMRVSLALRTLRQPHCAVAQGAGVLRRHVGEPHRGVRGDGLHTFLALGLGRVGEHGVVASVGLRYGCQLCRVGQLFFLVELHMPVQRPSLSSWGSSTSSFSESEHANLGATLGTPLRWLDVHSSRPRMFVRE